MQIRDLTRGKTKKTSSKETKVLTYGGGGLEEGRNTYSV